jgi:glycosyltransferase involved in cell wall biosynthesis
MLVSLAWLLIERRHSYSMIHAHIAGNMAAVSSIVGWLLGKPVLVKLAGGTEMQGGILDPMPRPGVRIRKALMRHASAYQATSLRIASLLADRGFRGDKVLHIPNAVNMARFAAVARDHELRRQLCGERARVGVFVGRLESEKGIELMIQGWARVFAERSDAALMLVGDGSLREALQRSVQSLGIASQVVFVGPATQVERYLALADFGVLTSQYEGLSNALLEYMAAGLPVVGSEVSGTEDWVINGRTGWLFPPGSLEDLVRVLAEVADTPFDELRRLGHEAQTLVDAKASIPAMVDALQRTYRELEQARA